MLRRTTAAPDKAVKFGDGTSAKHPLPRKTVSAVIRNTEQNARNEIKKDCGSSRVLLNVALNSGIMTGAEVRQSFLDFFREKEHAIVPSSSLMPDAPNLLFTNAGMNQFVPIFLGQQKPPWKPPRVADTPKCIRPGGPCSELHVDLTPDGDTRGALVNKDDPRCIEIWNLVFIQFNANADGSFRPLPQRHVDTGLGLERTTAIIQGTKNFTEFSGTVSNYETDIFLPIFDELEKLSGKKYGSTLPKHGTAGESDQEQIDIAFRVIADHIRALSFPIADGIVPSNEGRGYVLRRILRRAVRYGRTLGFHGPFFSKLVNVVAKTMGDVFPEVPSQQKTIRETIRRAEEAYNK